MASSAECFLLFSNDLKEVKELNTFYEMLVLVLYVGAFGGLFHFCNERRY